jgi:biopolymer transport protein ExbD
MTPLIDVVFLLIVFFVLVSRIVDEDRPKLDLPAPTPPATMIPPPGPRAVVSVVGAGGSTQYMLAGTAYPAGGSGRAALRAALTTMLAATPEMTVQIRADQTAAWQVVAPVLDVTRDAGAAAGLAGPVQTQLAATRERGS